MIALLGTAAAILLPVCYYFLLFSFKRKTTRSSLNEDNRGDGNDQTSSTDASVTDLPGGETYEVFLNFRGEDTRKDFTDHLYKRLMHAGVWVFRDDEALRVGEEIGSELDKAIKASKISIPIISPNYASSKWCLRELVHILECKKTTGHVVLPVFYRVEPSSVRNQTATFEKAFRLHEKKNGSNSKVVQEWRNALAEVASLKGWESAKIANGHEGELVEIVVTKVLNGLKKTTLTVTNNLVGIVDHKEKILKMIGSKESSDAQALVIHGMGGVGKTTLAKIIYNQLSTKFDCCSFLPNIHESLSEQKCCPKDLQKQLISNVLGQQWSNEISHVDDGINVIKDRVQQKKVLILFDDVSNSNQLDALARERGWFKCGSILIISTRNKDVLKTWEERLTYELNGLDPSLSFLLFCKHAFRRDECPSKEFDDVAKDIVSTTGGLPLAIEIIGSMLLGKSKVYWEGVFKKLQKIPHQDVQKKLRITYDALESEQKQMFLDIACLPIQYEMSFAFYMWDACDFFPEVGIEKLISLSLVKIGEKNQLIIHDQLQDLGRAIVREEGGMEFGNLSRLWDRNEAFELMQTNQGTAKIQALDLNLDYKYSKQDLCFTSEQLKDLAKLRFLRLGNANLVGDFKNLLLDLRWFQWTGCPSIFLPTNFHPIKLVVLDLSNSSITEHWGGWAQIELAKKLKVLILRNCDGLTSTPDFSTFGKLEILSLRTCINLKKIHPSICNFKRTLLTLDVRKCSQLEELPIEMGEMEELRELLVDRTPIRTIPISEGFMTKLEILSANECERLQHLPDSIASLGNLAILSLNWCTSLMKLPKWIGNLKSLTELKLNKSKVMDLPSSIGDLHGLKVLDISSTSIKSLPASIGKLKNLQHFIAAFLGVLEEVPMELPKSIGNLKSLTELRLTKSKVMELPRSIGDLHGLKVLRISGTSIKRLPTSIGKLTNLQDFTAEHLRELTEVPDEIGELSSLQLLSFVCCGELSWLPESIHKLCSLRTLNLSGCKKLKSMPDPPVSLTYLGFSGESMERVPNMSRLLNLKDLTYQDRFQGRIRALNLVSLNNLSYLHIYGHYNCSSIGNGELTVELPSSLMELEIFYCPTLRALPNLSNCKILSSLKIKNCPNLSKLSDMGDAVAYCELTHCDALEGLSFSSAKNLKSLLVKNSMNLVGIQGLDSAECLETLIVEYCPSLERLGDLSCLKMLKDLRLFVCDKLSDCEGIDQLTTLQRLENFQCSPKNRSLDLSKHKNLNILRLGQFEILKEILVLQKLEYVNELTIYSCNSIDHLPDISLFPNLEVVEVNRCEKLMEINGLKGQNKLKILKISCCNSLESLPDISLFSSLEEAQINGCEKLTGIKVLQGQNILRILDFSGCKSLRTLPDFSLFTNLKHLIVKGCEKLTEIKGLPTVLRMLDISGCMSLVNLPDFSCCCHLEGLLAGGCNKLGELIGLEGQKELKILDFSGCKSLKSFPDFSLFTGLEHLSLNGCEKVTEVKGLSTSLKTLDISKCQSLVNSLDISRCQSLKGLLARGCDKLTKIIGLSKQWCLEILNLSDCQSLEDFPDFSQLEHLRHLNLNGCEKIAEIKGLPQTLKTLEICGCKWLTNLPDFSQSYDLEGLLAQGCSKLVEIQGLENLDNFRVLVIHGCESLIRKPDLPKECIRTDPLENTLWLEMTLRINAERRDLGIATLPSCIIGSNFHIDSGNPEKILFSNTIRISTRE